MTVPELDPRPRISSILWIEGDELDPNLCTQELGLQPMEIGIKGQMLPGRRWPVPHSFWRIGFSKQPSASIDQELHKLLDLVWPARERIKHLIETSAVSCSFVSNVTIEHDAPLLHLNPDTLSRLAFFQVEFGIDIFDFSESTPPPPPFRLTWDEESDPSPVVRSSLLIEADSIDEELFLSTIGLKITRVDARRQSVLALKTRRLYDIDESIAELLAVLAPSIEQLKGVLTNMDATGIITTSVWIHKDRPLYYLSPGTLERLASLQNSFALEIYDYRDSKVIVRLDED